jgi:hypothetical protein
MYKVELINEFATAFHSTPFRNCSNFIRLDATRHNENVQFLLSISNNIIIISSLTCFHSLESSLYSIWKFPHKFQIFPRNTSCFLSISLYSYCAEIFRKIIITSYLRLKIEFPLFQLYFFAVHSFTKFSIFFHHLCFFSENLFQSDNNFPSLPSFKNTSSQGESFRSF